MLLCKLQYFLKVNVIPVGYDLLVNECGKSMLRARERILVSPQRPLIVSPAFNNELTFYKQCGLHEPKICRAKVKIPKSFYRGDEIAYFQLTVDNSEVGARCNLVIIQEMLVRQFNSLKSWKDRLTISKRRYVGVCDALEPQKIVQVEFNIVSEDPKM